MGYAILGLIFGIGLVNIHVTVPGVIIIIISIAYIALRIIGNEIEKRKTAIGNAELERNKRDRAIKTHNLYTSLDPYFDAWLNRNGGLWKIKKDYGKLILTRRDGTTAEFIFSEYTSETVNEYGYLQYLGERNNWTKSKKAGYEFMTQDAYYES